VYTYSLRQGIDDGFLAPYKVVRIDIDKDLQGWRPEKGQTDKHGQLIEDRIYNQKDFDRTLVLEKRTELVARKITEYLKAIDPFAKTIVFCEDIDHAERMRQALVNLNPERIAENRKYVMRITGDEQEGKAELDNFINPESRYPVIATTSKLLTTGVDAQTCKFVVLDQRILSMTEFKQMIGRGTRINEDFDKYWFTIMDFKKATELFADPAFDGDPVQIFEPKGDEPPVPPDAPGLPGDDEPLPQPEPPLPPEPPGARRVKYVIGGEVVVYVVAERVQYYGPDGRLITESLKDYTRRAVRKEFASLDDFLRRWSSADRKQAVIEELEAQGVLLEALADEVGKKLGKSFDPFDLICHVAFDRPPLSRRERAEQIRSATIFSQVRRAGPAGPGRAARQVRRRRHRGPRKHQHPHPRPFQPARHPARAGPRLWRQARLPQGRARPRTTTLRLSHRHAMSISTTIKSIQDIMRKDVGVDGDAQRIGQLVWMLFLKILRRQGKRIRAAGRRLSLADPRVPALAQLGRRPEGITGDELLDFVNNQLFPTLKNLQPAAARPARLRHPQRLRGRLQLHEVGHLMRQVINKIVGGVDFNKAQDRHLFGDIYEQILRDLQNAGNAGEYYTPRPVTEFMVDRVNPQLGEKVLDPACGTGGFLTCAIEHVRKRRSRPSTTSGACSRASTAWRRSRCRTCWHHQHDPARHRRADQRPPRQHPGPPARDYGPKDRVDVIVTNPPFGGMEEDGIENNFPAAFRTRETADLFLVLIMHLLKDGGRAAVVLPDGFAVRRRHQDAHQGASCWKPATCTPSCACPTASFPLHRHQDQPAVLHQGLADAGRLVLRAPLPAGREELQQDPADAHRGVRRRKSLVERSRRERTRVEGQRRRHQGAQLQPRHQESAQSGSPITA
jgi:hypothetical protein